MSIERFPARRAVVIWLMREVDAWLVLGGDHGWLHGDLAAAIADAQWLSNNLQLPIRFKEVTS